MRLISLLLSTVLVGLLVAASAFGGGSGPRDTCHGKVVTFKGTNGKDEVESGRIDSGDVVALGGDRDTLTLRDVKNVTVCGGRASDSVYVGKGTGPGIVIDGEEGVDLLGTNGAIDGGNAGGPLRLIGGSSQDYLNGGSGKDRLQGGGGHDSLSGHDGADRIAGGPGDDNLAGDGGADLLLGGDGSDSIIGGEGAAAPGTSDKAVGGSGNDTCRAGTERSCERNF
jgi:Ca2+-binding RTX toxin-like protein